MKVNNNNKLYSKLCVRKVFIYLLFYKMLIKTVNELIDTLELKRTK